MGADLEGLESALGHQFRDRELLVRALTHRSRLFDLPSIEADNEQLEFLGDSILGFLVSEYLVTQHAESREGRLSKLKAHLVSSDHLHIIAQQMNLGDFLVLGKSEEVSGGRLKRTLLADALEALIAALYLDGGMDVTRLFVESEIIGDTTALQADTGDTMAHSKTELQELAQKKKLALPRYRVVREEGPHHQRTFVVEACVGTDLATEAEGLTKKSAEQKAARQLLERLRDGSAVL
ncbi:MAG: ribonuclease III [Bryobacteraceae bacterium]